MNSISAICVIGLASALLRLSTIAAEPMGESVDPCSEEWRVFEETRGTHHPWNSTMALPASVAEAGLVEPVTRVSCIPIIRDGGSIGVFVRDVNGNYLAFAIPQAFPLFEGSFRPRPTFYLGVSWWKEPGGVEVPHDSPCEKMLISLFGDGWRRFEERYMKEIQRARDGAAMHPEKYKDELEEFDAALADYARRRAAEPGATDNPDDARRSREDH